MRFSPRIGLIGAGIIAESRVPALRTAGFHIDAVAARARSPHVGSLAARHDIALALPDWRAMLDYASRLDAFVVSTWPDGTPEILEELIPLGLPILVEKPVAWNTVTLGRLCEKPHCNVIVGYNRRHYHSVQQARCEVQKGGPVLAQLTLPTDVTAPDEPAPDGRYMQQFYESVSALGLDLTRYVLGDLHVESVSRLNNSAGNRVALSAICTTPRGDVLQISCPWGAPANYELSFARRGFRFELRPFEIGTAYEGMDVEPPSDEYPIRRYTPRVQRRFLLEGQDLERKPGFVSESMVLRAMCDGVPAPNFVATLEDALEVTRLCEKLTGVQLGDTNPSTYHH